jgi:hypothetical protein
MGHQVNRMNLASAGREKAIPTASRVTPIWLKMCRKVWKMLRKCVFLSMSVSPSLQLVEWLSPKAARCGAG